MDDDQEHFSQERRRAPRIGASGANAEYSIDDKDPSLKKAFVKDICIYGICIFTPDKLDAGSILSIDVELPGDAGDIRVKGKVMWQKLGDVTGYFNTGIEFTEISNKHELILSEFIAANYRGDQES